MKISRKILASLLLICFIFTAVGCTAESADDGRVIYTDVSQLNGKPVGIMVGTYYDKTLELYLYDSEIVYVNTFNDLVPSLLGNKIECFVADEPWARYLTSINTDVVYLNQTLVTEDYGLAFPKNEHGKALCDDFNAFLSEQGDTEAFLNELAERWFSTDTAGHPDLDLSKLTGENGTISICTDSSNPPFEFIENDKIVGYNIELLYRFCESRGYALTIADMKFDAEIAAITAGKYDIASGTITITEERKESVYFSDPIYSGGSVVVIRASNSENYTEDEGESFIDSVVASFVKTFITEGRYKMFIEGIKTSLIIAAASLALGTLLGFGAYMWYRRGGKIFARLTGIAGWLITGMPEVLFLLILYYIIFGKLDISGTLVSIIAFSIIVMNNVFGMTKNGVDAIDKGQGEAALALGYTKTAGFFRVIFPQALKHILPNYRAGIISLIKSTAIVGYVAVQDLTKVSDIIRSRTYEPFFPLIVTAIMYFVLAWLLIGAVDILQRKLLPLRRDRDKFMKRIGAEKENAEEKK